MFCPQFFIAQYSCQGSFLISFQFTLYMIAPPISRNKNSIQNKEKMKSGLKEGRSASSHLHLNTFPVPSDTVTARCNLPILMFCRGNHMSCLWPSLSSLMFTQQSLQHLHNHFTKNESKIMVYKASYAYIVIRIITHAT